MSFRALIRLCSAICLIPACSTSTTISEGDDAGTDTPGDVAVDTVADRDVGPAPFIAIDTHIDTTTRMLTDDIGVLLPDGHLDLPRMREGGLHGAFFSIWPNSRVYSGESAWQRALSMIRAVRTLAEAYPDGTLLSVSSGDVRRAVSEGKIALLMGLEGGHALGAADEEATLARLREVHEFGVRYMTLTWSTDNSLGHSSTGSNPELGLTDLGRRVVGEMNRLGMVVDVSHVSDRTFEEILDTSTRPVLATHSSARALAEHPRNMTDAMIRRVGEAGGAVCINFYARYIDIAYATRMRELETEFPERFAPFATLDRKARTRRIREVALELDPSIEVPDIDTIADHIEHVVSIGGSTVACLGSDFDGVPEMPDGLEDVSQLPALRLELEDRGLDTVAIFGGNVLRVLDAQ